MEEKKEFFVSLDPNATSTQLDEAEELIKGLTDSNSQDENKTPIEIRFFRDQHGVGPSGRFGFMQSSSED